LDRLRLGRLPGVEGLIVSLAARAAMARTEEKGKKAENCKLKIEK
jgi:hypothetical protein